MIGGAPLARLSPIRRQRRTGRRLAVLAGVLLVAGVAFHFGVGATDTMLQKGEAQRALAALREQKPRLLVRRLDITPGALLVQAIDPEAAPSREIPASGDRPARQEYPAIAQQRWQVTHWLVFRLDWYRVTGPTPEATDAAYAGPTLSLEPDDIPSLATMARQAVAAAGAAGASATRIDLDAADAGRWRVAVATPHGETGIDFDRTGKPIAPPPTPAIPAPPAPAPASASASDALAKADAARDRKDFAEAVRWYREAADQGDAAAQFNLGVAYDSGAGVARDPDAALGWWRKAAEQGQPQAQNLVGEAYALGRGVAQDYVQALHWYRLAADKGYAPAQLHLGTLYANGNGVALDYAEALHWYRLAADQGEAAAQYDVGLLYARGLGAAADRAEAHRWMEKAAAAGSALARRWLAAN